MNAGKAVYGILSANSGVTDIVGTRIFPEIAEQEAVTPFVVYQLLSVDPEDTHDGPSKLDEVRFEFLCYADSYNAAADLGVAVRAALDRVSGTYNGVNVESVQFNDVDVEIEYDPRRYSQVLKFTFRIKRDDVTIALGTPVTGAVLGDLNDVDVTGVTNGQLIAYNDETGNWEAADDAGGVTRITQLEDTAIVTPDDRELLLYDGGQWVNDTLGKGDVGLANVDNTSDANKPVSTATQTALDAKADTSSVPTELNDLSDVTITGTPTGNQALIFDGTANVFKSLPNFTNRFEDEAENNKQAITPFAERVYTVKADGDGIFIDAQSDTPTAGKVIKRKIYQKAGFLESGAVIGDFTLIHTFADDTAYSATESTFEGFRDGDTYGTPPFTLIQTWEEVTAAPAFTGLLNESYGSGAEAAYSTRRLNGNVTDCMVIRRASDSTTTTIGFDSNGNIDESAIETFCTGTTCTVYQWLDQSGNDNTATAPSTGAEPTIYTGGALVKENGKVAITFSQSTNFDAVNITGASSVDFFNVFSTTDTRYILNGGSGLWSFAAQDASTTVISSGFGTPSYRVNGTSASMTTRGDGYTTTATGNRMLLNAAGDSSTWSNYSIIYRSQTGETFNLDGNLQEAIYFTTDKSSERTQIEENIGDYFTQNTPLLDTYSGAAAAYSLRLLDSTYTGDAVEVYNGSSYADIGFNVFGELDTVALADHCGSNDGFVSKWYDQAGSNDATQTTTSIMPKIYDGTTGVITNSNGKPAIYSDDSATYQTLDSSVSGIGTTFTHFSVLEPSTIKASRDAVYKINTRIDLYGNGRIYEANGVADTAVSPAFTTGNLYIHSLDRKSTEVVFYGNGSQIGQESGAAPSNTYSSIRFFSSGNSTTNTFNGYVSELIFYTASKTDDRTNIESNLATFYGITL